MNKIKQADAFKQKDGLTLFNTPLLTWFLRLVSVVGLKLFGWKIIGKLPRVPKCVMIAAPHTSNWDAILMLMTSLHMKAPIFYMVKDSIIKKPVLGKIASYTGGVGVDRSRPNGMVGSAAEAIKRRKKIVLAIPPEGTRKKTDRWKTGFYHIARSAEVPIVLSFLDYGRKQAGIYPIGEDGCFQPTGDIDEDFKIIKRPYRSMKGKYPENQCVLT